MPSTRTLSKLPDIEGARRRLQQLAALDSVFAVDDGVSQFGFHPDWDRSEQMGAVKTGSGDELFAHFTPAGCCMIGFAHESAMSPYRTDPPELWPGLLADVPAEFQASLDEPAFDLASTTFVIWRLATDDAWRTGQIDFPDDPYGDGSADLLRFLDLSAAEFTEWIAENYEVDVDGEIVSEVFLHQPLNADRLRRLNRGVPVAELRQAVSETGFPTA